jgi:hypothetical protein
MAVLALAAGGGCAYQGRGGAAAELRTPAGGSRVVATAPAGVTLIVEGNVQAPDATLREGGIPLLVTIQNRGTATLAVRPSDFALVGPAGQRYPAMVEAEVMGRVEPPPPLVAAPTFSSETGDQPIVAADGPPPVWPVPALSRWETSFPDNWAHIKGYAGDPAGQRARIQAQLLPEGALPSGHAVAGLLFFDPAAARSDLVALRADLTEADDGLPIARAVIPLRVVR